MEVIIALVIACSALLLLMLQLRREYALLTPEEKIRLARDMESDKYNW